MKKVQAKIHQIRTDRGFTMDPLKIFILLNEEVGEVAAELKKSWSPNYDEFDPQKLAEELADVQVCLCALANQFNIDLETAVEQKFIQADSQRVWRTASPQNAKSTSHK